MDIAEECAFVYYNTTSENGTFLCSEKYLHVAEGPLIDFQKVKVFFRCKMDGENLGNTYFRSSNCR